MARRQSEAVSENVSAASFRWEPVPDEIGPDDPRRRRRVRALVVACVVGALAIIAIAVVATVVLKHEADKRDERVVCPFDNSNACPPGPISGN